MTKQFDDKHTDELNISDAPIRERHSHTNRGYLAHDHEGVDDEAINEELHNVIAAYWKDRQKPGFVGYKDSLEEDEEKEVRVENDVDVSFLKNPRWTIQKRQDPETIEKVKQKPEEENIVSEDKTSTDTLDNAENTVCDAPDETMPAEPSDDSIEDETVKSDLPDIRMQTGEKINIILPESMESGLDEEEAETATQIEIAETISEAESVPENDLQSEDTSKDTMEQPKSIVSDNTSNPEPVAKKTTASRQANRRKATRKRKKKKGPFRVIRGVLTAILIIALLGTSTIAVMRYMGWRNSNRTNDSGEDISTPDGVISEDGGKTVVYKGVTYYYNEDLSTILFIGVDKEKYEDNGVSGDAGQADTVILTVVNQKTGETRMIPLSRSTMVAVDQYNTDGSYWKQENVQLAVSFAYGTTIDENCKNVAKAVSRILYGMPVHRYVTMDLSAIPQLNDAVGGVTVDCLEDLTDVDETWTQGAQITLHGKQAETYVRHRKTTITDENQDNNAPRMERQKQYVNNFIHTLLSRMKGNVFIPLRLYRDVGDDIYSDVTTSEIVYYTSMIVSKGFNNSILSINGSVKHGKFTEFYPNDEELYQLILDTFYERQ